MNLIYRFSAILIKILASYFVDISKLINVYMERQFVLVQSLTCLTAWDSMVLASLSFIISLNMLELMSVESVMLPTISPSAAPSSCPQSFPASESFPMSWLFASDGQSVGASAFSIGPSSEYSGLISFRVDWFYFLAVQATLKSSLAPQFESVPSALSLLYGPTFTSIHDYWKNHSFEYMDLCQESNIPSF